MFLKAGLLNKDCQSTLFSPAIPAYFKIIIKIQVIYMYTKYYMIASKSLDENYLTFYGDFKRNNSGQDYMW